MEPETIPPLDVGENEGPSEGKEAAKKPPQSLTASEWRKLETDGLSRKYKTPTDIMTRLKDIDRMKQVSLSRLESGERRLGKLTSEQKRLEIILDAKGKPQGIKKVKKPRGAQKKKKMIVAPVAKEPKKRGRPPKKAHETDVKEKEKEKKKKNTVKGTK